MYKSDNYIDRMDAACIWRESSSSTVWYVENNIKDFFDLSNDLYVIKINNVIVACVLYNESNCKLMHLAVHKEFRRQGKGTELVNYILSKYNVVKLSTIVFEEDGIYPLGTCVPAVMFFKSIPGLDYYGTNVCTRTNGINYKELFFHRDSR